MRVGLVIYGRLDTLSGGFLYDRMLVERLRSAGDQVEIISLPWRSYAHQLSDNLSPSLRRRLRDARLDILLQDELNHPSLLWLNRQLKSKVAYPVVSIVHNLRCLEARPAWQNRFYRWIERHYLETADGFVFNSEASRAAVHALVGDKQTSVVAYPGGDRLRSRLTPQQVTARAQQRGPLRILFIGNVIPRKELHTLLMAPIASNAGGASEFIAHGREGFLVSPGDIVALAQHIQELLEDRPRLAQMSLAALERFRAHPTWAEGAGRIRDFLQALVK